MNWKRVLIGFTFVTCHADADPVASLLLFINKYLTSPADSSLFIHQLFRFQFAIASPVAENETILFAKRIVFEVN